MKKKIFNYLVIFVLLIFLFEILTSSKLVIRTVHLAINIWFNNVFPTLFPFFILSDLLINYGFVEISSNFFSPIISKLFKTKKEASFVFIMSMLSGSPGNAKYIKELYTNKIINNYDAEKILMFTHFSNPLFIIGTIGISFLNNSRAGIIVLLSHYIGNIFIGFLFRNYHTASNDLHSKFKSKDNYKKNSLGLFLSDSILNSINTLLLVLGTIIIFLIITAIINDNFSFNEVINCILNGFFEMTQGLKFCSLLNVSLKIKTILCTFFISFGGFSIHMQVMSILSDTKVRYLPYFASRIIHAIISSFFSFLLI